MALASTAALADPRFELPLYQLKPGRPAWKPEVSGTVLDATTLEPIAHAATQLPLIVRQPGLGLTLALGGYTDEQGAFHITAPFAIDPAELAEPPLVLTIDAVGYERFTVEITYLSSGQAMTFLGQILLKPQPAGGPIYLEGAAGHVVQVKRGADIYITRMQIGIAAVEEPAPTVSSGAIAFIDRSQVEPPVPGGPEYRYHLKAVAAGHAIVTIHYSVSSPRDAKLEISNSFEVQ